MNKISPEQEQEITEHYLKGTKRSKILRLYNITHNQFEQIVRISILKEYNKKTDDINHKK